MENKKITLTPPVEFAGKDAEAYWETFDNFYNIPKYVGQVDWFNYDKFLQDLDNKVKARDEHIESILTALRNYWGKYIRLTISDTNKLSDENIIAEYVMMPYKYERYSGVLFGIICKLNDKYSSGVKDEGFELVKNALRYQITIEEIEEDDFIVQAHQTVSDCMNARILKIESGEYALTNNGYVFEGHKVNTNVGEA